MRHPLLLLLLAGCAAVDPDLDGDGLADVWELDRGLSTETDDTDGDGWTDREEVYDFTDADDPDSMPYAGGWDRRPVPDDLEGTGTAVGDVLANGVLVDQFGESVDMHHFYGNVLMIESGAEWCGPCNEAAAAAEEEYQHYRDQGFLIVHWLGEDAAGNPTDTETAARWAETHGLTFPVLADANWSVSNPYERDSGIPTFHLVGRDMTLRVVDGYVDASAIEAALAEEVPEVEWDEPTEIEEDDAPVAAGPSPLDFGLTSPFGGCSAAGGGGGLGALFGLALLVRRRR